MIDPLELREALERWTAVRRLVANGRSSRRLSNQSVADLVELERAARLALTVLEGAEKLWHCDYHSRVYSGRLPHCATHPERDCGWKTLVPLSVLEEEAQ